MISGKFRLFWVLMSISEELAVEKVGDLYVRTKYYFNGTLVNTVGYLRAVYKSKGKRWVFYTNGYRALEKGDPPTLKVHQTQIRRPSGTIFQQIVKARLN